MRKSFKLLGIPIIFPGILLAGCEQSSITSDNPSDTSALDNLLKGAPGKHLPEGMLYNEYNRNYYQAIEVSEGITWSEANVAAQGMRYGQCSSHLAMLTSQNENEWVTTIFPQAIEGGYWLGGTQESGTPEPGGGWEWITGENWLFTNWAGGEHNNLFDNEESLHLFPPSFGPQGAPGTWNDQNGEATGGITGYLVEYECPTKVTGGGQLLRDVAGETQKRVYGFNAHKDAETNVKGQAQGVLKVDQPQAFHVNITCQSVWGNDAWLGGIVTQSNDPAIPEGRTYLWHFEDNGQGKEATDNTSLYVYSFDESPIDLFCDIQPTGGIYDASFEVGKGDIKVR